MSREPNLNDASPLEQDALLDDLESIKELLNEEEEELEASVKDSSASERLDNAFLDALLANEWQRSASDLLTQARGAIEAHRNRWTPEDTDELNEALRERMDATLTRWLRDTVRAHMDELRAELLAVAEETINGRINLLIEQAPSDDELDDHG